MRSLFPILFGALLPCSLGAQQWLRPWCTGNGPADFIAFAEATPTTGIADMVLSVGYCASPTNPATYSGVNLRIDYDLGPVTWTHGGFLKVFIEFSVVDQGACTPFRELLVRAYGWSSWHCDYVTFRNARARIAGSSMEFAAVAGGDTTYRADGTSAGPNLWRLVVPQTIVCPTVLQSAACATYSATLAAIRSEWPLTATPAPAPRRFTLSLDGPPSALVWLYLAPDPLPFGVSATLLPPLAGLFHPDCFWFSPFREVVLQVPIAIPWQYVGLDWGWVALDANGHAALEVQIPDLTPFLGGAGHDSLAVQGIVLPVAAPPPAFGLTNAVEVFVHR